MLRQYLIVAALCYPFAIYFGLNYLAPSTLGSLLAILVLLRVLSGNWSSQLKLLSLVTVVALVLLYRYMQHDQQLLKFYPVAVNLIMLFVFSSSLLKDSPLIETIALDRGLEVGDHNRNYLRILTIVWSIFFLFNVIISTMTAINASMEVWLFYNGFLSYLLTGLLVVGELIYRRFHKRRVAAANKIT